MTEKELREYTQKLLKEAIDRKKELDKLRSEIKSKPYRRICTVWYHHFSPKSSKFKKISRTGRISTEEVAGEFKVSKPTAMEINKVVRYLLLTEEYHKTLDKSLHVRAMWKIYGARENNFKESQKKES